MATNEVSFSAGIGGMEKAFNNVRFILPVRVWFYHVHTLCGGGSFEIFQFGKLAFGADHCRWSDLPSNSTLVTAYTTRLTFTKDLLVSQAGPLISRFACALPAGWGSFGIGGAYA